MMRCGKCGTSLTVDQITQGGCPRCAQKAIRIGSPSSRLSSGQRLTAWLFFALFAGSLMLPFGLISSCWVLALKGNSICAASGCRAAAKVEVSYSKGVKVWYCDAHANRAPSQISSKQGQFGVVVCALSLLFVVGYIVQFKALLQGSPDEDGPADPRSALRSFVIWTLGGILGTNGLAWLALYF